MSAPGTRGTNKPLPIKVRHEALRLRETGASFGSIAATCTKRFKLNVSEAVVRKWCKAAAAEAGASPALAYAPEGAPPAPPPGDSDLDTIAELRALLAEQRQLAKRAREDGNTTAAARALKAAGDAANTLARLEAKRMAGAGEGDIVTTRAEYARVNKELLDRVAALAADLDRTGGLVCGECGRRIRIRLAKGEG